jgi:tRNA pseudouridine55 synthase
MGAVTPEDVRLAALSLTGRISQVPPMVSAVKIGGRRLHELAREGVEVERPPRSVNVTRFDVEETAQPSVYRVEVDCSAGTYVRVLAADLGEALGGGAHLRRLRRTSVGSFTAAEAAPLGELGPDRVLPLSEVVRDYKGAEVDGDLLSAVRCGKVLDRTTLGVAGAGPWPLSSASGALLAVYEAAGPERVKPAVVLEPLGGGAGGGARADF